MAELNYRTPKEIEALQLKAVKQQVDYAATHSAFYKDRFKNSSSFNAQIQSFLDFQSLRITTKEDLSTYNDQFLAVPKDTIIDYVTTSGTLGTPISFALNEADLQRLAKNEHQSFLLAGLKAEDVVQITTTLDRRFMAGLAYFLGLRSLGASCVRVGSGLPALQFESIMRFKPNVLVAVPSFLLKLIDYAKKELIDINSLSIEKAICIGEPLRTLDNNPNTLHQQITKAWDIELLSTYASTEMSTAFTECLNHNGLHEQSDLIFTEVLDESGNPVAPGNIGELVVTPLHTQTMPLLRFATGDMVKQLDGICSCGRHTKRYSSVIGRKQQLLKVKGTSFYPQQCFEALGNLEFNFHYVLKATTNASGNDDVKVLIDQILSKDQLQQIKEVLQSYLRVSITLKQIDGRQLQDIIFSKHSRKPVRFIDER